MSAAKLGSILVIIRSLAGGGRIHSMAGKMSLAGGWEGGAIGSRLAFRLQSDQGLGERSERY